MFKSRRNKITKHLNFRKSGQKIQPSSQIKYLGVLLQDDLHRTTHLVNLRKRLNRSFGLLSKIRHYLPKHLLRTMHYSLFNSTFFFMFVKSGDKIKPINSSRSYYSYKKKALKLVNFQPQTSFSNNLFKESRILEISDFINYR